jgi:NDP-sugar pyrophosphorylase family protein
MLRSAATMQVVILAGGLATRMHPRTLTVPKWMLEVAGRPFCEWQLELLARCKYERVVACIAHLGEQIRNHVGDGSRFGVHVEYSSEGETLLGTAGALHAAVDLLEETFLVVYGDSYLPFDYAGPLAELRAADDCDGVMTVFKNNDQWDASNVRTDGTWVLAYEKGVSGDASFDYIDYGAIALKRRVVLELPPGRSGLDALQTRLASNRRLRAHVAHDRFYEIGSPEGLASLERRLKETG